jgi:hypothetical protein
VAVPTPEAFDKSSCRQPIQRRKPPARPAKPVLAPDQSAALRDRLVAEADGLQSADEATNWAHRSLPAKNTLTAADAELVEAGFRAQLATFSDGQPAKGPHAAVQNLPAVPADLSSLQAEAPSAATAEAAPPVTSTVLARRFGCATRTTSSSCPSRRALCAAANPPMRIIFVLRSHARWDAKSAMNSRFRFVAFTIASFTGTETRQRGGRVSISIQCRLHSRFGEVHTLRARLVTRRSGARRIRS